MVRVLSELTSTCKKSLNVMEYLGLSEAMQEACGLFELHATKGNFSLHSHFPWRLEEFDHMEKILIWQLENL